MRRRRPAVDPLDALPAELATFDPVAWIDADADLLEARRRWTAARSAWCRDTGASMVELLRRERAARRAAHGWTL